MNLPTAAAELAAVTRLVSSEADPQRILERAARSLYQVLPGELVAILELPSGEEEVAEVRAVRAEDSESPEGEGEVIDLEEAAILRQLSDSLRTRILDHSFQLDRELAPLIEALEGDRIRSALLVPVRNKQRCLGFLAVLSSTPSGFTEEHVRLAQIYGDLVGLVLDSTQQSVEDRARADRLEIRNRALAAELDERPGRARFESLRSPRMQEVLAVARQVAETDAPVLLLGETGVGKEVLARQLHAWSPRRDEPFIALNCAALPRELIESELFGHARGAFSGAHKDRPGRFEVADGGTLLLDEIGEMPIELQPKLLRVLQEGRVTRVGTNETRSVDVRIIAATNVDLSRAIREGSFREDLFFRLNVFPLNIPPLRERLEDLPVLCEALLESIGARIGKGPWELPAEALRKLEGYDWPGNIRELANTLERSAILSPGPELKLHMVEAGLETSPVESDEWPTMDGLIRSYLEKVLRRTSGRVYGEDGAAALLGMKPTTLQSRLKRMGIDRRDFE